MESTFFLFYIFKHLNFVNYQVSCLTKKQVVFNVCFCVFADLSNDSYGTVVNMGLDGEGASPGGAGGGGNNGPPRGYLSAATPPYLTTSRSPSLPPQLPYPSDLIRDTGLSIYTTLGKLKQYKTFFKIKNF